MYLFLPITDKSLIKDTYEQIIYGENSVQTI